MNDANATASEKIETEIAKVESELLPGRSSLKSCRVNGATGKPATFAP
jgi:hypothetical protein